MRGQRPTSSFLISSLTLAVVSDDCFPLDVSLMSVDRKLLHFFTFSSVSCKGEDIKGSPKLPKNKAFTVGLLQP